tara:strand:+ start:304 stop:513 length:210 start_codon:yes stop_codon:yes gene_type:complete
MYDEYISKAKIKMDSKFGDKKEACALLLKAIDLLKNEIVELKKPKKTAVKKPAAKKPAAKKTTKTTTKK